MVRSRAAAHYHSTAPRTCAPEPNPRQRQRHSLLVSAFFAAGLVQCAPALKYFFVRHFAGSTESFPFWVQLVLLIAIVEFAFALSLIKVVDFSALWVLSLISLLVAMTYAFLLALVMFARQGMALAMLELTDSARGIILPWTCLGMLSMHALFAWIAGRSAVQWRKI